MRKYGISILLSWQVVFSIAQNRSVEFIPIKAELSQNTVTDILQDHNGFLWIGTRNGLNKYDGANMVTYEFDELDSSTIPAGSIQVIYEDSQHTLWIGTKGNGLCRYVENTDSFDSFISKEISKHLGNTNVLSVYEDTQGILWIGTESKGLISYNRLSGKVSQYKKNNRELFAISGNEVTSITEDSLSNLWVATFENGLNLFDRTSNRFMHFKNSPNDSLSISSNMIGNMHKGHSGRIWLSTAQGLNWIGQDKKGKYVFRHQKVGNKEQSIILPVLEDSKGNLWVGVENEGLYKVNIKTKKSENYKYNSVEEFGIKTNSIWSLVEDKTGIIWVGTYNKGLYKIDDNAKKFNHYKHNPGAANSLSNSAVTSFVEDKNHNIWIGTDGGGLNYWNVKENTFWSSYTQDQDASLPFKAVLCLLIDSRGNLWVGTWRNGVFFKPKGSSHFEKFSISDSLNNSRGTESLYSIIEDKKGNVWFATFGNGIYCYSPVNKSFKESVLPIGNIKSNFVTSMLEDSQGQLWVGTVRGLDKVEEFNNQICFKHFPFKTEASGASKSCIIHTLLEDSGGRLWLGTNKGLLLFNQVTGVFQKFSKKEGLPNEVIYAIEEDLHRNLWLSSNRGLSKFNLETKAIENFTTADGLQAMEFFRGASLKLNSGELLFGGIGGFNRILPDKIIKSTEAPVVYLIDFKVNNKSVKFGSSALLQKNIRKTTKIELTYQQNDFGFEFGMISFKQTPKNTFAYQLEGYDRSWQKIGNSREAFFTNIPPGSYTFKVKATNSDGLWSKHQALVKVVIAPPWYATYFAYAMYIMLFIVLLTWGYHTIINKERLKAALQVEHIELVKMQELDEMKSNFFTNISHEFRTPLTLILGPLKSMFKTSKQQQVAMMIRNGERLLQLIDRILDLSKLEAAEMQLEATRDDLAAFLQPITCSFLPLAEQKNINYEIKIPKEEILLYFDKEKLEKVIVNLLSNAFKYTPQSGKIICKLEKQKNRIILTIEDKGIGIPADELCFVFNRYYRVKGGKNIKQEGTGIGLSLTKELVELHKGSIEVESVEGEGTVFKVYLKKGKQHLSPEDIKRNTGSHTFLKQEILVIEENSEMQLATGTTKEEKGWEGLPILLIIDDNEDIRNYIRKILEPTYKVLESSNGIEGMDIAIEQIPDLIISDIMMPGVDGLEVCKKLKADIKTSHIPVILLTAKATNESTLEGFKQGADYYITKPFDPQLLTLRVRNALNTRNYIRENIRNKKTLCIEPEKVSISPRDQAFITQTVSIVEKNMFDSEFTIENLAAQLSLSRTQLYRKMKGLLGQSANEFIRSLKLKRAVSLLEQSQMTISEITYEVGFSDLKYFRDCFKKQFGITPSEYMAKFKNKKADSILGLAEKVPSALDTNRQNEDAPI